jgi:hypothetical protein
MTSTICRERPTEYFAHRDPAPVVVMNGQAGGWIPKLAILFVIDGEALDSTWPDVAGPAREGP